MTKVKNNLITTGLSGKLGKQVVFRQWGSETFLAKAPVRSQNSIDSELRIKNKLRFKEASAFAKKAMNDPELKQAYKKKCKARVTAYARAVQDFFNVPSIGEIDLSNYSGETNSFIRVYTTDDFRVNQVKVRIENQQSEAVEAGFAEQEGNTDWWRYIVTEPNLLSTGGKIIVSAYDLPGNEATMVANI